MNTGAAQAGQPLVNLGRRSSPRSSASRSSCRRSSSSDATRSRSSASPSSVTAAISQRSGSLRSASCRSSRASRRLRRCEEGADSPLPPPEAVAEALAQEKLDRRDPRPNVRDLDLDSLLLAAARTGRRDPHLPRCAERGVEQRGLDVIERSSRCLGKPRTNLCRVGMAVPARESGLDLSDERLGHGALSPSRKVSASDSLLSDLLDQRGVMRAERRVGEGGGATGRS